MENINIVENDNEIKKTIMISMLLPVIILYILYIYYNQI